MTILERTEVEKQYDQWKSQTLYRSEWKGQLYRKEKVCQACGAHEGEFHQPGCGMEQCPSCKGQLISCDCLYETLNLDRDSTITSEHLEKWYEQAEHHERIPFIAFPLTCDYCGELYPQLFITPEWNEILPKAYQKYLLCLECFEHIKAILTKT